MNDHFGSYESPLTEHDHDSICDGQLDNISDGEQAECATCRLWYTYEPVSA